MDYNFKFDWNHDDLNFLSGWFANLLRKKMPSFVTISEIKIADGRVEVNGGVDAWYLMGHHEFKIHFRITSVKDEYGILLQLEHAYISRWPFNDLWSINNVLARSVPKKPWVSYSTENRCIHIAPLAQLEKLGIQLPGQFALDFSNGLTLSSKKPIL